MKRRSGGGLVAILVEVLEISRTVHDGRNMGSKLAKTMMLACEDQDECLGIK
jgi:hypothetical protein